MKPTAKRLIYLFILLSLIAVPLELLLDREDARRAEKMAAAAEAYAARLEHIPPDSLDGLAPVDRLFLNYRGALPSMVDSTEARQWADSVLATLSTDQKIGQLLIVGMPETIVPSWLRDEAAELIATHHVGGFLIPRAEPPKSVRDAAERLQKHANVPLFIAADYERGAGSAKNNLTELGSNMSIGATDDTVLAAAAGRLTAIESRAVGVNVLFAPVVDVNNNPDNPIINVRSYGEDPERVAWLAQAFVREAQRQGVLCTIKHFPGHGDTNVDTHSHLGVIAGSRNKLERTELLPYRTLLAGTAPPAAVMTAHLWAPAFDSTNQPATFSKPLLTDYLRGTLRYNGLIITDDVGMGALKSNYSLEKRYVEPLKAGADIVLSQEWSPRVIARAIEAIRAARIPDLDARVRRILIAKAVAGLHRSTYPSEDSLDVLLKEPLGAPVAAAIAERAITVLKAGTGYPLPGSARVALVHLSNQRGSASVEASMAYMARSLDLKRLVVNRKFYGNPEPVDLRQLNENLDKADVVVVALYLRITGRRSGLSSGQEDLVRALIAARKPVVLVTLGNPYAIAAYQDADVVVVGYDQSFATVKASTDILLGRKKSYGRLPIRVGSWPRGSGL